MTTVATTAAVLSAAMVPLRWRCRRSCAIRSELRFVVPYSVAMIGALVLSDSHVCSIVAS